LDSLPNAYVFDFDINSSLIINPQFTQGDINASVIEPHLLNNGVPVDITGETIEIRFLKADNTIVYQDETTGVAIILASEGIIQCTLEANTLAAAGIIKCEIHRTLNGIQKMTQCFYFTISSVIGAGNTISQNYISSIDTEIAAITGGESMRITSEGNRVIAEGSRVTAEDNRVISENSRVIAENGRVNDNTAYKSIQVYSNTNAYIPLNSVTYGGSTYQNILACTGVLPTVTSNWIMTSQAGSGSNVTSSVTNGHINVNGVDTSVYSDTAVSTALAQNAQQLANIVNQVEDFYSDINVTDTQAVLATITACPIGGTIQFKANKSYTLASLGTISKQITIDFNGAEIILNGTGDFLTYQPANASDRATYLPPKIKKGNFTSLNYPTPTNIFDTIIKIGNITIQNAINVTIEDCKFYHVTANHSLIRNVSGYGTLIKRPIVYDCTAPYGIYFNQYSVTYDGNYSYNNLIRDLDITTFTGIGVAMEGGAVTIEGTSLIESCAGGGIKWLGTGILYAFLGIGIYFEDNQNFDISLYNSNGVLYCTPVICFKNCRHFGNLINQKIIVGKAINLKCEDNFYATGGIYPDAGGCNGSYYIGINNTCNSAINSLTGFSNRVELHDSIFPLIHHVINCNKFDGYELSADYFNVKGTKLRSYMQDTDNIPSGNYTSGDIVFNRNCNGGLKNIGLQCATRGTQDTITGITGSGIIGTPTLTINTNSVSLTNECIIAIVGLTGTYKIIAITGLTLTLDINLSATCSGAVVSLSLPVFRSLGTPSYKNSYVVNTLTIQQSDVAQNSITGMLYVYNASDGTCALYIVSGSTANGGKFVTLVSNPNTQFSDVKDTASLINVYMASGFIQIQNNSTTSKTIRYHLGLGL